MSARPAGRAARSWFPTTASVDRPNRSPWPENQKPDSTEPGAHQSLHQTRGETGGSERFGTDAVRALPRSTSQAILIVITAHSLPGGGCPHRSAGEECFGANARHLWRRVRRMSSAHPGCSARERSARGGAGALLAAPRHQCLHRARASIEVPGARFATRRGPCTPGSGRWPQVLPLRGHHQGHRSRRRRRTPCDEPRTHTQVPIARTDPDPR